MTPPADAPHFELFFNHSFDLLAVVGTDGCFKQVNPAFERVLGYPAQELVDRPVSEFLHPDDVEITRRRIGVLTTGTPTVSSVNRYRCKDGTYKWISWNTMPQGPVFFTVGRDITLQREAEEKVKELNIELARRNEDLEQRIQERMSELRRAEEQMRQLQKMDAIGRLAGGIAHDFNNMLGAMSVYCDLIQEQTTDPAAVLESVNDIRAVTTRATALTRQLLIFSRKQVVQPRNLNLNPVIEQLEKMLGRLLGERVRIVLRLGEGLKEINVDPSQMEQVLLNLAVNAKDAMPQGGRLTLETSNIYLGEAFTGTHLSVSPGHYVMLSVSDEGIGMDAETLSRAFEPFFTTKPVDKGTGLGLTTIYGIIKQAKGSIWVYSEVGKGTVFKIYLPVSSQTQTEPTETQEPKPQASTERQTILLTEDDASLRAGFADMLSRRGYEVLVASNAEQALELCRNHPGEIHLLLTDVVMPGINGFELSRQAQPLRPRMRVLVMSGYTDDALEGKSGEFPFLEKPFDTRTLVAKVQAVLADSN